MTRLRILENKGWKVTTVISTGNVIATKGLRRVKGASITDVHRKIFGY